MSKLKHPFQKKQLSLARDRRPVRRDGEGAPVDPREKVRVERNYRHEVRQALHLETTRLAEDDALVLDQKALAVPRERVKKTPAVPLGEAIAVKEGRRTSRTGRHKKPAARSKKQ
jgi:hypothetical protein